MQQVTQEIITQIEQIVIGKTQQIKLALACVLAKGHLLIEDLPGMGKTTLAHVLASTLGLSYQRVQFTSDLLPADIIGVSIFDQQSQSFTFHKGPLFNQVVLADEINRASPKTQSSLLEAMEEFRVSVDGHTHDLPSPFFVIATQNPFFNAGTYPLPESQLDRFMMKISLGFPDRQAEREILKSEHSSAILSGISACIDTKQLQQIQERVCSVFVSDQLLDYVIALCETSRQSELNINPLSPRAGKAIVSAAKAWAFIHQRDHVIPDDVKSVFSAVCEHRLAGTKTMNSNNYDSENNSLALLEQIDSHRPFN